MEPSVRVKREPRPPRAHQVPRAGFSNQAQAALALDGQLPLPCELYVLGRNVNKPLDDVEFEKSFPQKVMTRLRADLGVPSALQMILMSNLKGGSETVMIHKASLDQSEQLRKTLAYMLPVLHFLKEEPPIRPDPNLRQERKNVAPRAIVITPSEAIGHKLSFQLRQFLDSNPFSKSFSIECLKTAGYNSSADLDILITDAKSLHQSKLSSRNALCFDRLKFLVFEDTQCYLGEYSDDIKDTINLARVHDTFVNQQKTLRLIISSLRWTTELERLYADTLDVSNSPTIYIESHAELTKFAKVKSVADYVEDFEAKIELLKDIGKNKLLDHKRVAISCSTDQKAMIILKAVLEYANRVHIIKAPGIPNQTEFVVPKCREYENREIFIITDPLMEATAVKDCTYFVSFDGDTQRVNQKYLEVGSLGLQFMWKSLPQLQDVVPNDGPFQRKVLSYKNLADLVAHFLFGSELGPKTKIGDFYLYSKELYQTELSPTFEKLGKQISNEYLNEELLCDGFKLFGSCNKPVGSLCYQRHHFNEKDVDATVAGCGEIDFQVVHCDRRKLNAYRGKLLSQYTVKDGKRKLMVCFDEKRRQRSQLLEKHCRNKLKFKDIKLYTVYGVQLQGDFLRAKVIKINPSVPINQEGIFVELIDEGKNVWVSSLNLFNVPMDVTVLPPFVVEVVLGNLRPPNQGLEFIVGGMDVASRYALNSVFRGKVWLAFGNTVWVNPMMKLDEPTFSLRTKFIELKAAEPNSNHLFNLLESAKRLGEKYKYWSYIFEELEKRDFGELYKKFHKLGDCKSWAFLDLDDKVTSLPVKLKVTEVTDPWLFHGIQSNFEDLLEKLEVNATDWADDLILEHGTLARLDFFKSLAQDQCVLVKHKDSQRWKRGITTKKTSEDGYNEKFEVFLVDYGILVKGLGKDDVLPISKDLVTTLPFQAIKLRLNHVEPREGKRDWNLKDINIFKKMISEGDGYVHVTVRKHKSNGKFETQPNCYFALAVCGEEELGALLVQKSMAEETENVADLIVTMKSKIIRHSQTLDVLDADLGMEDTDDDENDDQFDVVMGSSEMGDSKDGWFGSIIESLKNRPDKSTESTEVQDHEEAASDALKQGSLEKKFAAATLASLDDPGSSSVGVLATKANNDVLCPTVYWYQTKTQIVFSVQIVDCNDFNLTVERDGRTINFLAGNYAFNVKLFGKVLPQYSSFPTGQRLKIAFSKRNAKCDLWIRINQNPNEKLKWLKKDPEHLEESDDDETEDPVMNTYSSSKYEDQGDSMDSDDGEDQLFSASLKYWNDDDIQKAETKAPQLNLL